MMSGMNIATIIIFIISASARNASDEVKSFILNDDGYKRIGNGMYKERFVPVKISIKVADGKIKSEVIADSLRKTVLTAIDEGGFKYKSGHCSNALYKIDNALSLPLNQRKFTGANIRKLIDDSKKSLLQQYYVSGNAFYFFLLLK